MLESMLADVIRDQFKRGWEIDIQLLDSLISTLGARSKEIEVEVVPTLPSVPKGAPKATEKVHKANGEYTQLVIKWFPVDYILDQCVAGPFTKVQFIEFNIGSHDQVKKYLLANGWVPTEWNRKRDENGRWQNTSPKITEDSLKSVEHLGGTMKLISEYIVCNHRLSNLKTWREKVEKDSSGYYKLYHTANTVHAPTARMAHRVLVNVPNEDTFLGKEMRQLFIAPTGYKVVGCDAKGCQMRMLAHHIKAICGRETTFVTAVLHGTKENNDDVHCLTQKEVGLAKRSEGKTLNYAILFGQSDPALSRSLGCTERRATAIKAQFFKKMPELKRVIEILESQWQRSNIDKSRRFIVGLDGRPIFCNSKHKLVNYLVQSDEAILMKYFYCLLWNALQRERLDAHIVLFYHDEVQIVAREDHAERVAELSAKLLVKAGQLLGITVPTEGDPSIGNNWRETH
jgi:DNA polymerase I-like protein with 3'-5' exonuclease and polymerase domains